MKGEKGSAKKRNEVEERQQKWDKRQKRKERKERRRSLNIISGKELGEFVTEALEFRSQNLLHVLLRLGGLDHAVIHLLHNVLHTRSQLSVL